jgi:hypothetical protein
MMWHYTDGKCSSRSHNARHKEGLQHEEGILIDKLDGVGSIRGAQATREVRRPVKTGGTSGSSFVKHLGEPAESEAAMATGGVGNLGAISQLAGLQEVDDALARRKRGRSRAVDILDKLESSRVALLTGSIGKDQLLNLAQMVSARRSDVGDPKLAEILDDIELRARVELAKLGF